MNDKQKAMAVLDNDEKIASLYNYDFINLDGNWIHKTAIVHDNVRLGQGNIIGAYSVIGTNGEMRKPEDFKGDIRAFQESFEGTVWIGNDNVISEHVTIQRPFETLEATTIGHRNIIMAHSHIGHNVIIGNDCEVCTGTIIGGYTTLKDGVRIKLGVTVRNRRTIGANALVGLGSVVVKDVEDAAIVYGNPAK